jgi:hypothetical protein
MKRLLASLGIPLVVAMLVGFFFFTKEISEPVEGTLQPDLVKGTVRAAEELAPRGPFLAYVALYAGRAGAERPEFPVSDVQPEPDGSFALAADRLDGRRFFLLARIETAQEELFCETVPLPEMRVSEDGDWVVAATGRPLEPRAIVVDASTACDWY